MNTTESKRPIHLVFIHGAWVSGWGWDRLLPYFSDDSYQCHVVALPDSQSYEASVASTASIEDYIAHVGNVITGIGEPVYLIAHSGGGLTATGVAEFFSEQLLGIVYVAGMMLPSGVSFPDICQKVAQRGVDIRGIAPYLSATQNGCKVSLEGVRRIFLQDADAHVAAEVFEKMLVQPNASRVVTLNWTLQKAGSVPKYYIKAEQDRSLVPEVQDELISCGKPKAVASLDCGHFPQLVMPASLAELIKDIIKA